MRFTVRRPPTGEVSPCCHRPSGGDVACSVDVGVAPSCSAGLALEDRLALAVPGRDVPARGASLRRIGGRDLLDPAVGLVLQARGEQSPAAAADRPVQPAFLSNAYTGLLEVPRAERVIARTSRASILIVSKRLAMSVVAFSTQSLRRSVSRALSFAIARFVRRRGWSHVWPGRVVAAVPSTAWPHPGSDWVRAAARRSTVPPTATPGRCPPRSASRGPQIGAGMWANAICQRPARSRVTR